MTAEGPARMGREWQRGRPGWAEDVLKGPEGQRASKKTAGFGPGFAKRCITGREPDAGFLFKGASQGRTRDGPTVPEKAVERPGKDESLIRQQEHPRLAEDGSLTRPIISP